MVFIHPTSLIRHRSGRVQVKRRTPLLPQAHRRLRLYRRVHAGAGAVLLRGRLLGGESGFLLVVVIQIFQDADFGVYSEGLGIIGWLCRYLRQSLAVKL